MGRPKRVYPKSLHKYDKQHTQKVKMFSGTEITALHLVKETDQYFMSIDSWAFCCSKFKKLKYGTELKVELPVLTDIDAISFLEKHAWTDWVAKSLADESRKKGEMRETIELLDKLFPTKKKVYFYELKSLIASFCHGNFISYDENTGDVKKADKHDIDNRKYYTSKYNRLAVKDMPTFIKTLYDAYDKADGRSKKLKDKAFDAYYHAERDYIFKKYNLTETFVNVCKNAVVCPYIFSSPTVKGFTYEHAGEVYFIETPDTIYFETERHF